MKITLNPQEKHFMRDKAEEYRQQTGDNYSVFHILSILTQFYEDRFEEDLNKVMDIKIREFQENQNR